MRMIIVIIIIITIIITVFIVWLWVAYFFELIYVHFIFLVLFLNRTLIPGHMPLQFFSTLIHSVCTISFTHLVAGIPFFLLLPYGIQIVTLLVHLSFLAIWPANFIFSFQIVSIMSSISVFALMSLFLILSFLLLDSSP